MSQILFYKAQVLKYSKAHKEDSLNPNLNFSQITQSPQRCVMESSHRLKNECVLWIVSTPSKGRKGKFLYLSQKTRHLKLASKNWNIWNLKYTCYSPNWMPQFEKPKHLVFPGLVRCGACDHCVSLISLRFLAYVEQWDFVGNPCGIPLNRMLCQYSRLNIKYISSTWACTSLVVATSLLFLLHKDCHM
jgi:hypothetical protein